MSKVGIIVDGQGDFAALRKRFGSTCKVLKTDGPRGHTVTPDRLAQSSKKQLNMLRFFGCTRVIIVTDFEERREKYTQFVSQLRLEFEKMALTVPVRVVVPNIMIENWYLADIEYLSKRRTYLRSNLKQKRYEGKHGKQQLKKLFKHGIDYNEVKHGTDMFSVLRLSTARQNSLSFAEFLKCFEC
jgi:hypothetical protein